MALRISRRGYSMVRPNGLGRGEKWFNQLPLSITQVRCVCFSSHFTNSLTKGEREVGHPKSRQRNSHPLLKNDTCENTGARPLNAVLLKGSQRGPCLLEQWFQ